MWILGYEMKVIIPFVIIMLCSCDAAPVSFAVYAEIPVLELECVCEVLQWVSGNIEYVEEREGEDNWQNPSVTYYLGSGDCEDFVILSMYLIHRLGIESKMVVGTRPDTEFRHAWIEALDQWWEPRTCSLCDWYIYIYEDFDNYDYDYLLGEYEM